MKTAIPIALRLLVACLLVVAAGCSSRPEGSLSAEWPSYGHDYGNQRFSPVNEIRAANVSHLVPAYIFQTGVLGAFEATPIVSQGVLYLTTANDGVFALDAENGDVKWQRAPLKGRFRQCCGPVNRGAALSGSYLLIGQIDGSLLALDKDTGDVKWATSVGDNGAGYSITMAPLVYGDSVLIGVAGSEFGIRGSLSSYSVKSGKLQWRWYATDASHWFGPTRELLSDNGRLDVETSDKLRKRYSDSWKQGGGGVWSTPAIDPSRNTVYASTGNPWPDETGKQRPGDNLYTDCIVALDATTGRMRWYFQETPHDTQDLDAASPPFLFDTIDSRGRGIAAVGEVGKDGILYILDRDSGRLIRRSQNVASLGSTKGRVETWHGGSTWSPVAFDPTLGYAIISAAQYLRMETNNRHEHASHETNEGAGPGYGTVSAVDVATGRIVWQDEFDIGLVGGAVSTAGGLTFVGEGNGYFDALDTANGKRIWRFQTGAGVNAAPIAFELHNREYLAVASGGNQQFGTPFGDALVVFALAR